MMKTGGCGREEEQWDTSTNILTSFSFRSLSLIKNHIAGSNNRNRVEE